MTNRALAPPPPEYTRHPWDYERNDARPANLLPPEVGDTDLVIAIDFGTTFTGVAYCLLSDKEKSEPAPTASDLNSKITVITTWPDALHGSMEKIPTILGYSENGNVVKWGCGVKETHKIRVAHFKLGFQPVGNHYHAIGQASALGGFLNNPDWEHPKFPNK